MIPPIDSAVHQSIGFLVRGDMLQRDLLQTFLLKISDNVSRAQIADSMRIAEIQSASSNDRSLVGGVPDSRVVPGIAAVPQVLEKCVLSQSSTELKFSSTDSPSHEQDQSEFDDDVAGEESSTNTRDTAFRDSASLAILNTLRAMLPDLAISGLCSSLFSCLLPGRTDRVGIWGQEIMVILIPLDGILAEQKSLYVCGFSRGFDSIGRKGLHGEGQDVLSSLPELKLATTSEHVLSLNIQIVESRSVFSGRGYRLGDTKYMPDERYVLRLEKAA